MKVRANASIFNENNDGNVCQYFCVLFYRTQIFSKTSAAPAYYLKLT